MDEFTGAWGGANSPLPPCLEPTTNNRMNSGQGTVAQRGFIFGCGTGEGKKDKNDSGHAPKASGKTWPFSLFLVSLLPFATVDSRLGCSVSVCRCLVGLEMRPEIVCSGGFVGWHFCQELPASLASHAVEVFLSFFCAHSRSER